MEFEWDPLKADVNFRKHGVSFPSATRVFLDEHRIESVDVTQDYGEDRLITIGLVEEFEIAVVYSPRQSGIRMISARKANRHERQAYGDRDI